MSDDVQGRIDAARATGHPGRAKQIVAANRPKPKRRRESLPASTLVIERRMLARRLRAEGLSLRAIAGCVGVSHEQVRSDLAALEDTQ